MRSVDNGRLEVMQRISLESVLPPNADVTQCKYNTAPCSLSATVLSLILASIVVLPVRMLTYLLHLIRSKPIQEWSRRKALSSLHDRETNNSVKTTKKKGILLTLQEWYQNAVIQSPSVPLNVLAARSEWVSHYGGYDSRRRSGRRDWLRLPEQSSQKALNQALKLLDNSPENSQTQLLLRTLMYAKDAEYGMVTLHASLCDLIDAKAVSTTLACSRNISSCSLQWKHMPQIRPDMFRCCLY
jgi:hypothetical protein